VPAAGDHPVITPLPGGGDLGLVDALAQLTFAVQAALGRIAAAHDLSIAAIRLLGILRDRRPAINDLARLLQLDKSSATGLVDRAEERGLVRRTPSTLDRRSVQVTITAAGQELIDQGTAAFEAEIAALTAGLSLSQRSRLSATASRIVAADARRRGIDILSVEPAPAEGS
jgi:MarR family transcriptional regulator, lower aerobic nicotinate degradation pathway regulator